MIRLCRTDVSTPYLDEDHHRCRCCHPPRHHHRPHRQVDSKVNPSPTQSQPHRLHLPFSILPSPWSHVGDHDDSPLLPPPTCLDVPRLDDPLPALVTLFCFDEKMMSMFIHDLLLLLYMSARIPVFSMLVSPSSLTSALRLAKPSHGQQLLSPSRSHRVFLRGRSS